MGTLSVDCMLGILADETFVVNISVEEIVQRSMTVPTPFARSVVAKFVAIAPATVPALSHVYRVWSLATGHAIIMLARMYVVR